MTAAFSPGNNLQTNPFMIVNAASAEANLRQAFMDIVNSPFGNYSPKPDLMSETNSATAFSSSSPAADISTFFPFYKPKVRTRRMDLALAAGSSVARSLI